MTTITVKNIPEELYDRLKLLAESNHRSINSEIIVCIERSVFSHPVDPEAFLAKARQLRERTSGYLVSDQEFTQAKRLGRL